MQKLLACLLAVCVLGSVIGCSADEHVGYEPGKGKEPPPAPEGAKGGQNMPMPGH